MKRGKRKEKVLKVQRATFLEVGGLVRDPETNDVYVVSRYISFRTYGIVKKSLFTELYYKIKNILNPAEGYA